MKILITGCNRGIGKALAELALKKGYEVIGTARDVQALKSLAANPKLTALALDVVSETSLQTFAKELSGKADHLDVLINNAGVLLDGSTSFDELTREQIEHTFAVNVIGPHRVTQIVKPLLLKSKTPRLVSVTSIMGSISDNSTGKYYAYRMSKTALNMWNKSFSIDHPHVAAIVVHPGWVKTEMGGAQALLEASDSAAGILKLAEELTLSATGKFFDYRGRELPW